MSDTTARTAILAAVRAARPPGGAAPPPRAAAGDTGDLASRIEAFSRAATIAGAAVVTCTTHEMPARLHAVAGDATLLSYVAGIESTSPTATDPHALHALDVLACTASLGVAENGAVWIATSDLMHRAALFLAERVVIVLPGDAIVATLHDAYDRLDVRATSFGTFVAGPSKTADIEQAMVIGAHGPKELTLIVTK